MNFELSEETVGLTDEPDLSLFKGNLKNSSPAKSFAKSYNIIEKVVGSPVLPENAADANATINMSVESTKSDTLQIDEEELKPEKSALIEKPDTRPEIDEKPENSPEIDPVGLDMPLLENIDSLDTNLEEDLKAISSTNYEVKASDIYSVDFLRINRRKKFQKTIWKSFNRLLNVTRISHVS